MASPAWDLAHLTFLVQFGATGWLRREPDIALIEARIADHLRDEGRRPYTPARFAEWAAPYGDEEWRRVGIALTALDDADVRGAAVTRDGTRLYDGLVRLVLATEVLPIVLVGVSQVRAEEFARHLAASLEVPIAGETPARSRDLLHRIDYRRLLEAAKQARGSAEERLEFLRQLQEQQDLARHPRGKA